VREHSLPRLDTLCSVSESVPMVDPAFAPLAWHERLGYQFFRLSGWTYVAAGSLVGFETLAVLVGYATIWPVGVPVAIAGIAVYAVLRRRIQRRRRGALSG
jgi:hypothetical protein